MAAYSTGSHSAFITAPPQHTLPRVTRVPTPPQLRLRAALTDACNHSSDSVQQYYFWRSGAGASSSSRATPDPGPPRTLSSRDVANSDPCPRTAFTDALVVERLLASPSSERATNQRACGDVHVTAQVSTQRFSPWLVDYGG